ncbi:MAG: hypothetical protein ABW091_00690 [Microbacterium sp.]
MQNRPVAPAIEKAHRDSLGSLPSDRSILQSLLDVLDRGDTAFDIVTP